MKREYFAMIFIVLFLGIYFMCIYAFGTDSTHEFIVRFIVIWLMIAYSLGQYSMRYPKRF